MKSEAEHQCEKIKIGFFGYGTRALDALMEHPDFDVKYFWAPKSRMCDDVYVVAERYQDKVKLEIIKNRGDLLEHVKGAVDASCFLMNASPIILNEPILEQMDFYNIHPGSLSNNRGHHPHLWSILLDEKQTQINLHAVTPEIDLGKVIASVSVPVLQEDTSLTLLNRTEDQIARLLTELARYLHGEQKEIGVITHGEYRPSVTYEDYHIHKKTDTIEDMSRKIRARAMHSGGFFEQDGKRYYVDGLTECQEETEDVPAAQITEQKGYLTLSRGRERIRFRESKITDQEGNVLWKRRQEEEKGERKPDTGESSSPTLFLAVNCLLTGCFRSDDLTTEDYAKADAVLQQVSQTTYDPTAKADGTPFRIAYIDIDPYPPSGEMFFYFVEQLIEKGWIDTGETLPFSPLDTDAKEMIRYISEKDHLGYLEFSDDITYYLAVDGEDKSRVDLEEEIQKETVDLIFCMGTWPGKFIKDMGIEDIPVMVYFSVDPEGAGISEATEYSGQENIWCHVNYTVYNKQLEFYHDNFGFENMGVLYYDESVAAMRAYRKVAETRGFSIMEAQIGKLENSQSEAEENYYRELKAACEKLIVEDHIDAFLLGTDIVKDESQMSEILQIFYQNDIPVFVQNGEYFVKQGALMLVTASDARDQAPFVTDTFAAILNGVKPGELSQEYLSPPYLTINLDAADELGYQLSSELILSAEQFYRGGVGE